MAERLVIALDQGTTSTRCIVFDVHGRLVSVAQREHRQFYPRPGWVEHDAREIWHNVQRILPEALAHANASPAQIAAIGIANQRETTLLWDRRTGVPALSTAAGQENGDKQVQGKASVEIIRVDPNSSEARVVSRTAGKPPIAEGDYISNIVYDPNATYQFFVYGKFDLDHNGVATAGEADIAKRLIEQWGGKLAADINVNTDFVVIGAEPVVPNLSKEEESDPLLVQRRTQAQADLTQYQDVINKARDLHIPILNQNRFLYFIGYYDQAKR